MLYTLFTLPVKLLYTHSLHAALAAVHTWRQKVNVFIHPLLRKGNVMTLNALEWSLQIHISITSQLNHWNTKNIEHFKYPNVSWNVNYSIYVGMWWTLTQNTILSRKWTPNSYIVSVMLHPVIYCKAWCSAPTPGPAVSLFNVKSLNMFQGVYLFQYGLSKFCTEPSPLLKGCSIHLG